MGNRGKTPKIKISKELVYGGKLALQYQVVARLRLDQDSFHTDYDLNFISSLGYIKTIGFPIVWKLWTVIQAEPGHNLLLESKKLATIDQLLWNLQDI